MLLHRFARQRGGPGFGFGHVCGQSHAVAHFAIHLHHQRDHIFGGGVNGGGKSIIVDPDGRVLQQAGDHETILTEILDLDHVTRTREYGNIGMTQTLKQLRDSGHRFPIYQEGIECGEGIKKLGQLMFHRQLRV